jgi:hypothetical protein
MRTAYNFGFGTCRVKRLVPKENRYRHWNLSFCGGAALGFRLSRWRALLSWCGLSKGCRYGLLEWRSVDYGQAKWWLALSKPRISPIIKLRICGYQSCMYNIGVLEEWHTQYNLLSYLNSRLAHIVPVVLSGVGGNNSPPWDGDLNVVENKTNMRDSRQRISSC